MGTIDKAPGVSDADLELIKSHVKVLADSKRTIMASREPLTFLIDSITVQKVGEDILVKIQCTESGVDIVICEPVK
jgi:sporulation protein YlmC with PRC-barrel domain